MTGNLIKRANTGARQACTECHVEIGITLPRQKEVLAMRREAWNSFSLLSSEGTSPAVPLISDFRPPELGDNTFPMFKPCNWWCFVTAALSHVEADAPQTRLGTTWLDTLSRPVGVHWVGGEAAPLYSQDVGPCGPLEGSVVHLLQVCVSLQLPVEKDSVLSGVCTSCVTCHSCVHSRVG